jgi:hypothetical protein
MRSLNINNYTVLLQGEQWTHNVAPCCKDAIPLLENNETIVTWLIPKGNKLTHIECKAHIPAILFNNKYWTLSLRMSKCIYRHIRLRKGFKNVQTIHGIKTLRIPQLLFNEKQRTQNRFEV